jgi:monovalent cation:H+ antiporter-2, CPA2 family
MFWRAPIGPLPFAVPPLPVISLAQHADVQPSLVQDLLAILIAAGIVAMLLRRLNVATIPGYLIAGAVIGPHALGLASGEATQISHLATVLLMFIIGLHLDISVLRAGWISAALVGLFAVGLAILVGWPVGLLFGLSGPAALVIAMALSISSTAVVLRIMEQRRELHKAHGRLTLGVLIMQDLLVLAMMASIPLLKLWAGPGGDAQGELPPVAEMVRRTAIGIGGITALIVIGRWTLPRVLRAAAGSAEVLLVLSSGIALGAAVATAGLGFSPELGAFLAGFLLASTPFRYQLSGQLVPLRDLFLAVFFTAMGLNLDLEMVARGWWIILLAVGATLVIKALTMSFAAWCGGATGPVTIFTAFALAQGSEFSLVLLSQASLEGIITTDQNGYALATVLFTLVLTPFLMRLGRSLAPGGTALPLPPWVHRPAFREATPPSQAEREAEEARGPRAIVAGFGPVGRAVADALERKSTQITIIELNPKTVERQRGLGRPIIFGDAGNIEVLERAGLAQADAVILTMPDEDAVLRAAKLIRTVRPNVFLAARVNALSKAIQAMQLGADHVVVEELATAEHMAAQVLTKIEQLRSGEDTGPKLYEFGDEALGAAGKPSKGQA